MKRHLSILSLMLLLPFSLIYAQETACTSESVANSYAAAVTQGTDTQAWYQTNYATSNCSDNTKAFAESLVTFQYHYQGQDYPIFNVPTDDGVIHHWALIKKGRKSSQFIDPANPDAGIIEWSGNWRTLSQVFAPSKLPVIPTADAAQANSVDLQASNLFDNLPLANAVLSPDGSRVAATDQQGICIYAFADNTKNCSAFPTTLSGFPSALYWSPDSNELAFTENYSRYLDESDIWLFDTTTQTFSDMTDDHVSGSFQAKMTDPFMLDFLPTWNPATSDLFFIRSKPQTDGKTFDANLYRISVKTGDDHQVLDLSTIASTSPLCSISDTLGLGPSLHGVMTISPDGKTLALLVRNICAKYGADTNAEVWLIDLTGQNTPRLLVKQPQLQAGMPTYRQEIPLMPSGIAWAAGDTGLLVSSSNIAYITTLPSNNAYYIDVASGKVTPIMDFSKGEKGEFDGSRGTYYDVPFGFSVSADGKKLIMLSRTPALSILSLDLPPDGSAPVRIYSTQGMPKVVDTLFSTVSADGKIYMQGLLITTHT